MGKKKIPSRKKSMPGPHSWRMKYIGVLVVSALMLTLVLGAVVGAFRNPARTFFASAPAPAPVPPPANPSKEYLYAGSRLIATEEPAGTTLLTPGNVAANTLSNLTPAQVVISWDATSGADHYEVERTTNVSTTYQVIANNVTGTAFTDTQVTSVTAYLYRVRAVSSGGAVSAYSNLDVATAISFTDDTLTAATTPIRRNHITELRTAVNAVRATTANLSPASWAEAITAGATPVRANHIQELRTKLDEARSALNLPPCSYTSIAVGDPIQKVHFEQLRQCVK